MGTNLDPTGGSEDGFVTEIFDALGAAGDVALTGEYWLGILSSIILLYVRYRIKLPKLRVTGMGGGTKILDNGDTVSAMSLGITNEARFLGHVIKRDTLSVRGTQIYDPATGRREGPHLLWQYEQEGESSSVDIEAAQSARLLVYCTHKGRVKFYVGKKIQDVERSDTLIEIGDTRTLIIRIEDKLGRIYKIPIKVSAAELRGNKDGASVQLRWKKTFADRWDMFRAGLGHMIRAFSLHRY